MTAIEPGIHTVDTGFVRPGFDAAYLLVDQQRAAFIDCGTSHSVPHLLAALEHAGVSPAQVDWLILTHVHLDHAGGAGALLQHLPAARVVVHPRGERHLVEPTALWNSASAVYGEAVMRQHYGALLPVPAERITAAADGQRLRLGERELHLLDTPGHARHHLCVHDPRAEVIFTGDTFGLSYRELDSGRGPFVIPTTTPVQFDPAAMHRSIDRLMALQPKAAYLTHFGRVQHLPVLAAALHDQIDTMVAIAEQHRDATPRAEALQKALAELYWQRAQAHGCHQDRAGLLAVLGEDIRLNAQGLEVWLDQSRGRLAPG